GRRLRGGGIYIGQQAALQLQTQCDEVFLFHRTGLALGFQFRQTLLEYQQVGTLTLGCICPATSMKAPQGDQNKESSDNQQRRRIEPEQIIPQRARSGSAAP